MAALGMYDAQIYDHVSISLIEKQQNQGNLKNGKSSSRYLKIFLCCNLETRTDVSGRMHFMATQTILPLSETQGSDSFICI